MTQTAMNATVTEQEDLLNVTSTTEVAQQLNLEDPKKIEKDEVDPVLAAKAEEFAQMIVDFDPNAPGSGDKRLSTKSSIDNLGLKFQKESAHRSSMLKQPMKALAAGDNEAGDIADGLIALKNQVEKLDPMKFNLTPGWLARWAGYLPFVGSPLKNYFSKFMTADDVIGAICQSLEDGSAQLTRDNKTLSIDQEKMREITIRLKSSIQLAMVLNDKLQYIHDRETPDPDKQKFIRDELLFPLKQRVMDLQQQMIVNQQGVVAMEVIIRNNKELIRGINRALNVTVTALNIAATLSIALTNQKIQLKKIQALNACTNKMIDDISTMIGTTGVEIQEDASTAQLDIENLKASWQKINKAMEDISSFKAAALPKMQESINEMDILTKETEKAIEKMEKGSKIKPELALEV